MAFTCKVPGCTRKFGLRTDLGDHIRMCHTGERPFQCPMCGKRFKTGRLFHLHRLFHTEEPIYIREHSYCARVTKDPQQRIQTEEKQQKATDVNASGENGLAQASVEAGVDSLTQEDLRSEQEIQQKCEMEKTQIPLLQCAQMEQQAEMEANRTTTVIKECK